MNVRAEYNNQSAIAVLQLSSQYEAVFNRNFQKQQQKLVEQLYQQVQILKRQLVFYKKEVNQDNIQKLISQKRRQKQKQRQLLESRWRLCNQSFKKLQEQQKLLNNQLVQTRFDLKNIQRKIQQFEKIKKHQKKTTLPFAVQDNSQFFTQFQYGKDSSQPSPDALVPKSNDGKLAPKTNLVNSNFRDSGINTSISLLKKGILTQKANRVICPLNKSIDKPNSKQQNCKQSSISGLQIHTQMVKARLLNCGGKRSTAQLYNFLMEPRIKAKIYDILNRKI